MKAFIDDQLQILHYLCYCISVFESPSSDIFLHQCYSCIFFAKKGNEIEIFLECDIKVTNTLYGLTFL